MIRPDENYLRGSRLLMIDDSPVNLMVLSKTLEKHGAELQLAVNGEDGLKRVEAERPNLILLDVMMPGIDGFEVCRRLKRNPATSDIPVVFMTSLASVADKVSAFEAGGIDYLTKPLQVDEVQARVNVHLRLRALQTQLEQNNASLQAEINERQRLEKTLREQTEFQQSLLTSISDMGLQLLVIEGGRIVHLGNLEMAREFGYTEKMMADHPPFADFIHPEDRSRVTEYYRRRLSGDGAPSSYEVRLVSPSGSRNEFEITAQVMPDSDPVRLVSLCRNISERKQLEQELHQREEAFRAMAENTPDTIARYDIDCQQIYINPSLQRLLGENCSLNNVSEGGDVFSDSAIGYQNTIKEVIATGKETEYTLHWKTDDDRPLWSQIRIVPEHDAKGEIVSVLTIGRDVTELVQSEQQLRDSQKLLRRLLVRQEAKHDARQTWAAWEVYDSLGQLLMVQRIDIGLLQRDSFDDEAARSAHIEKMQDITDKAIAIVRSVGSELRPSAFNMGIVLGLEWIVEEFSKEHDIKCELSFGEDVFELADDKANMLFHVVQTSLENIGSRKQAKKVRISLECGSDCNILQVCDDGEGMDMADPDDGNLGLFYIQERVHAIGGEVVVLNQPGEGTLLEVRIPFHCVYE
jgi:PAS domain S-box-containing protein